MLLWASFGCGGGGQQDQDKEDATTSEETEPAATTVSSDSTTETTVDGQEPALETSLRQAVKDYYEAVDREDWGYTYDNLDSQTQRGFARDEWERKNQWFADNVPQELSSIDIDTAISPSGSAADVTVNRTFKDGSSVNRDTQFVYEDGSWKHQFTQEENDLFMPGDSFEDFVKAQQEGSSESPGAAQSSTPKAKPKAAPKTTPAQIESTLDQTAQLSDRTLTVNEVERNYQSSSRVPRPQAGNEFVRVNVSITNTSGNAVPLNPPSFKLQDSAGVQRNWQAVPQLPNALSSGSIASGGTASGNLVFDAPQGDTGLALVYTPIGPNRETVTVDLKT